MNEINDEIASGRFFFVIAIATIFWMISIPDHRSSERMGKIKINWVVARLFGSNSSWVNWRSLSFQMGFASSIFWYLVSVWNGVVHSSFIFVPVLLTILVLQVIFWAITKRN